MNRKTEKYLLVRYARTFQKSVDFFTIFIHCVFHFSCNTHTSKMSHLPRPTSAASTSSSSGIGTLPGGPSSKIPKPGFSRENSSLTKDDVTSRIPKIPKPGFSRENSTLNKSGEDFKVGDKVRSFQGAKHVTLKLPVLQQTVFICTAHPF